MTKPLLQIHDLSISFINEDKIINAVENITIDIRRGKITAIVGESGSGKSVTSLAILQLLPSPPAKYVSGSILFSESEDNTTDLLGANSRYLRSIRGNKISMIFQEPMSSLNPVHTCGNQVMEAILLHQQLSREDAKKRTIELFQQVHLPDPDNLFHRYPHQLSGGQKQRVMIAMAISCNPALLICDEPTTALDVTVQKRILMLIKELQQQYNMGVIFITHDLGVVSEIADSVVVMYKGKIVEQGDAADIYQRPRHAYTKALLACRPALQPKGERLPVVSDFLEVDDNGEIVEKSPPPKVRSTKPEAQGTNHEVRNGELTDDFNNVIETGNTRDEASTAGVTDKINQPPSELNQHPQAILKVQDLNVWFPVKNRLFKKDKTYIKAVNGVSFEVAEGETLGLVGKSGCGKTTLGRSILRLVEPTAGDIFFKGSKLANAGANELRQLRKDMQIIFQDPYSSLNPRIKVGSAIAEPLLVHGIGTNGIERKDRVMELLRKVNLSPDFYYRYPHEFSGGQRQRIVIARALALDPSFIICDESVSALDVSVQAQVLNLLNDLKKEFGFTAIFISHDLSVVRYISDRIMVMNKGKIEETGKAEDIYYNPKSEYTQRLIASIPNAPRML